MEILNVKLTNEKKETVILVCERNISGEQNTKDVEVLSRLLTELIPSSTFEAVVMNVKEHILDVFKSVAAKEEVERWYDVSEVDNFTQIRLEFDRALDADQLFTVNTTLGYALSCTICNPDGLSDPEIVVNDDSDPFADASCILVYEYDSSNSPRSDNYSEEAFELFRNILVNGSQIRTTNRSGPNTKGTRAVEGLGYSLPVTISVK